MRNYAWMLVVVAAVSIGAAVNSVMAQNPAAPAAAPASTPAAAPADIDSALSDEDLAATEGVSVNQILSELKRQYVAGGSTMHFILGLSVLGVAFLLERVFRLRRKFVAPAGLSDQARALWQANDMSGLENLAKQHEDSTLGKIVLFIVRHRGGSLEQVNAAASDISSRDMARHMLLTYPMATVAVIAPLLGLFGTVIGMVEAFESVAAAGQMGDPTLLSGSISKALITTAYGLLVAMPILFCYHMLKLRTNFLANALDEEASALINEWFLKAELDNKSAAGRTSK